MPLQFIMGEAGSGKTEYVLKELLAKSGKDRTRQFFLVVPEQSTMQMQKRLVRMQKNHSVFRINIVSFARLAYRVFEDLNVDAPSLIDETGKCLILRRIMEQEKDHLKIYRNKVGDAGFVEKMKSMISECYQYGLNQEVLSELILSCGGKPLLEGKLSDTLTIYDGFRRYLAEHYITQEEVLDLLCEKLTEWEKGKEAEFVFDGFVGQSFTPIQYHIVSRLISMSQKVTITLSISKDAFFRAQSSGLPEAAGLFEPCFTSYRNVLEAADLTENGVSRVFLEVKNRKVSSSLFHLNQNIFQYGVPRTEQIRDDGIQIFSLKNPREEAAFVAGKIREAVMNGARYRDIAVVTADMKNFRRYLSRAFTDYGIPFFADDKSSLMEHPFIDAVRSFLEILYGDFAYESVVRFLRCGFHPFSRKEVDGFVSYLRATGRRGYAQWHIPFTWMTRGLKTEELARFEEMRREIVSWTDEFVWGKKKMEISLWTRKLKLLMETLKMEEHIAELGDMWEREKNFDRALLCRQLYGKVIETIERTETFLSEERVHAGEFMDILTSGFEEIKIAIVPPTIDQVAILDMSRSRAGEVKILFFPGMNEGAVPKLTEERGILSQAEREFLSQNRNSKNRWLLAPTVRESTKLQMFSLYAWLTKPEEKLILSFSQYDMEGKAEKPSCILRQIQGLFEHLPIVPVSGRKLYSRKEGKKRLAGCLRDFPEEQEETKKLYRLFSILEKEEKEEPGQEHFLTLLTQAALFQGGKEKITRQSAEALFGEKMYGSVTALEQYAACGYEFFLNHGLMLRKQGEFRTSYADIGTLFHDSLEIFSRGLEKSPYAWGEIPEHEQTEMVREAVAEAAGRAENQAIFGNARNAYLIKRAERILNRAIWVLGEHIKAGKFYPAYYELPVSAGRIDRVDVYEENGKRYLRIIDYKSGDTGFQFEETYYGLQLQLLLYMEQAILLEKKKNRNCEIVPAGAFYYNLRDPIFEADDRFCETEEDKLAYMRRCLLKACKMTGLVNLDPAALEAMDGRLTEEQGESDIIPVAYKQGGGLKKLSQAISTEQFETVLAYAEEKAAGFRENIREGNIPVNPYIKGAHSSCEYCELKGVCGFDRKLPGYRYRSLGKMSKEEVLAEMEKAEQRTQK